MNRLSYLQDYEVAIQSISEELDCLKRHMVSGGKVNSDDMQELSNCLKQLQQIMVCYQELASEAWQHNQEPLPSWLQPKPTKSSSDDEDSGEPGSAAL